MYRPNKKIRGVKGRRVFEVHRNRKTEKNTRKERISGTIFPFETKDKGEKGQRRPKKDMSRPNKDLPLPLLDLPSNSSMENSVIHQAGRTLLSIFVLV